jgi:hypothetical protein
MSTLIYEEKMRELISLMPDMVNPNGTFKINYEHGTADVLNKYLLLKKNKSVYPLIWLVPQKNPLDTVRNTITNRSRFIIAKKSEDVDKFNEHQFNTDFKNVLIPVFDNFVTLLNISGITTIDRNTLTYELKPNFSMEDNGKGLITVWNAIVVDVTIRMDGRKCINKNLKFK